MKSYSLDIKDSSKAEALINFLKSLDFVTAIEEKTSSIPQWQMDEVRKRIETSKDEDYAPWNEAKKNIKR